MHPPAAIGVKALLCSSVAVWLSLRLSGRPTVNTCCAWYDISALSGGFWV